MPIAAAILSVHVIAANVGPIWRTARPGIACQYNSNGSLASRSQEESEREREREYMCWSARTVNIRFVRSMQQLFVR